MTEKYDANSAPQYGAAPAALPREHSATHQHNASHSHGAGHYSGQGVSGIGSLGTTAGYTPGNFQHAHNPADAAAPPQGYPQQQQGFAPQQQQHQQHYGIDEGVAYQQNMMAQCARGNHTMDTKYGVVGIIIAILCCPCGLIALCIDRKKVCTRCGHQEH